MDERWNSPFPYTLAYNLYKKHITELNKIYWAYVPANNTIKKHAKVALEAENADPKTYFLIPDADDRRVATSYLAWKDDYRQFENYTRLNMIMLISSCFETYLRTIISQAFESKPGVIIMCPDSVDGASLLKNRPGYGNSNSKNYQFTDHIDEICRGEWGKRFGAFAKYFGTLPESILQKKNALNEYRVLRNNIAHYLGRNKPDYTAPIFFTPIDAIAVSHNRVIKYFKLVNEIARELDNYLKENYIGSYDIIKFYYQQIAAQKYNTAHPGERANDLRRDLDQAGFRGFDVNYFRNIVCFCELDAPTDICRYSGKACIRTINQKLAEKNTGLMRDGRSIYFSRRHLILFVKAHHWKNNPEYCNINPNNTGSVEYRYSQRLIDEVVNMISVAPTTVIDDLRKLIHRE